ncbi:MAG: ABC transporter permease [Clostridiales bacterium]|nr:ABC transporter permease [Clostridiales bacterium]
MTGKQTAAYFIRKAVELLATLLLVSLFTFLAFSVIPGDTARVMLGANATTEQVEALRAELGLDRPLPVRYLSWLGGAFTGNLGNSTQYRTSVGGLIVSRLPVTLGMSVLAFCMIILISYPLAVLSSRKPGKFADQVCSVLGHILFAIPPFVLSLLLIFITGSLFKRVSVGSYTAPDVNFGMYVRSLMLPAFAIALPKIAMTFKFLRSSIIEQKASDYVATAKSHGLSDYKIMFRHILPNSNVSSITVISLVLSDILGGSLIVEQVFNLPGLGRLLLSAISQRDFPLLSGIVFYLALVTVILYFAADVFSSLSDPRIRIR